MILRLQVPPDVAQPLGLRPAVLDRLGSTVVLAGPNGGGKSRYLQAVERSVKEALKAQHMIRAAERSLQVFPSPEHPRHRQLTVEIAKLRESTGYLACTFGETVKSAPTLVRLAYPMEAPDHENIARLTPDDLENKAKSARGGDFTLSYKKMHAYLAAHAKALWDARHPDLGENDSLQKQRQRALEFDKVFRALLGRSLMQRHDGKVPQPIVGDRVFSPVELSEGEKLLVAWAITFFERGASLDGAIVVLDEPDVHLHADVCLQALTRLRDALGKNGQMWMATHSVPLIASVGIDSLYLVQDGGIEYASRNADKVVKSLLGGDEARNRLLEFLVDADRIAQIRFLLECLLPAAVAAGADRDPQQLQFTQLVAERLASDESLRILDYGAGKGRFALALREWLREDGREPRYRDRIEYHAFDEAGRLDNEAQEACEQNVAALGVDPSLRLWRKMSAIESSLGGTFDLVLMCNVLHEIPPQDWPRVMADVERLLSENGSLVIMEDLFPSVGELPHQTGFVILDDAALRKMVGSPDGVRHVVKEGERVMVAEIPKAYLRVTKETCDRALEKVCEEAIEGLRQIRKKGTPTHRDGRAQAVWAMQFANATLARG